MGWRERLLLPTPFQSAASCFLALERERSQGDLPAQLLRFMKAEREQRCGYLNRALRGLAATPATCD